NTNMLILSMKFPLKTGIGTDGQIPWPEKLRGPKETSNLRLLNSEDFLSAPQFEPRRRAYQKRQVSVHVLLLRIKSNTMPLLPLVTEGHSKGLNCGDQLRPRLPESALRA